jgi:hypothetical protein
VEFVLLLLGWVPSMLAWAWFIKGARSYGRVYETRLGRKPSDLTTSLYHRQPDAQVEARRRGVIRRIAAVVAGVVFGTAWLVVAAILLNAGVLMRMAAGPDWPQAPDRKEARTAAAPAQVRAKTHLVLTRRSDAGLGARPCPLPATRGPDC